MTIDRRRLLAALGAGGAAVLTGGGRAAALAAGLDAWPARTAGPRTLPPDWQRLRARLGSRLVMPGDPTYPTYRLGYNTLYDGQLPAAVARCASPADVQVCLDTARGHGIPIAARSGGHNYLGYSVPDAGLVIDLRLISDITVDRDGTARVGAGARLIEVYAALAQAGRLLPAGSCPTVGVSGLTLGGGIGVLTRKYGLTCDRLTRARLVGADSCLLAASGDEQPELYWALRGGGGGNFGIVTGFEFATEPAPPLTVCSLSFPAGSAAAVLGAWQEWAAAAPFELWSTCSLSAGSPPSSRVVGCLVGDPDTMNRQLDRLVAAAGVRPATRSVLPKSYLDAMKYMAGCANDTIAQCHPTWEGGVLPRDGFVAGSRMLGSRPLDAAQAVALVDGRSGVDVLFDVLGGAVARLAPDATAFPHRDSLASVQIYASTTPAGRDRATRTVGEIRDGLAALGARGAYVNYLDATQPDWGTAYYGGNLQRLKAVARRYDPDGVFAFPRSIAAA
ncbi:FAD-binding oxidoreductase [Kitasatospora sp. NPDC006697]|uniref:FAD-binding oxidoreductase n=1 Tax=Kitasatospora sp. NPDC006697 TaxID=3364020 RepID=UPI0036B27400